MPRDAEVTLTFSSDPCHLIQERSPPFPRFWDYQLKAGYDFNERHQLFFNIFASGDRFALKLDGENVDEDFQGNVSLKAVSKVQESTFALS